MPIAHMNNVLFANMYTHMWQSRVESKHFSIVYFNHITVFEAELPLRARLIRAV